MINIIFYLIQFQNTNAVGQKNKRSDSSNKRGKKPASVTVSKIDESYNTDKGPDILAREDYPDYRTDHEKKEDLQDIPSENSSIYASSKVRNKYI